MRRTSLITQARCIRKCSAIAQTRVTGTAKNLTWIAQSGNCGTCRAKASLPATTATKILLKPAMNAGAENAVHAAVITWTVHIVAYAVLSYLPMCSLIDEVQEYKWNRELWLSAAFYLPGAVIAEFLIGTITTLIPNLQIVEDINVAKIIRYPKKNKARLRT